MVPRKIDLGDVLAALGALLLLVALFLDWFAGASAWEAFETLDLVLALLALLVIACVTGAADALGPRLLAPLGGLLLLIVIVQLVEPPPSFANDDELGAGAWLALAAAAVVLVGGALRIARISVTVTVGNKDVRQRVPAVDRRGAGGAAAAAAPPPTATASAPPPPAPAPAPAPDDPTEATQPFSALEER
jgi:hypothetical protein